MSFRVGHVQGADRHVVLVVDDEPAIRRVVRTVLEMADFDVVEVDDGAAALELLTSDAPLITAVLSDVTMPGMTGIELVERLMHHAVPVPVVLSSGGHHREALPEPVRGAIAGFLPKPYSTDEIVAVVRDAIDRRLTA